MYICLCNAGTERQVNKVLLNELTAINQFETQLELMQKVGLQNWLQSKSG